MFCTRCGIELREQDKFCFNCGAATAQGAASQATWSRPEHPLTRPMSEKKIAGVCAGFARYFAVDVTLVRVVWLVLSVWPLPLFGVISYIVAWIVMPKDPVTAVQVRTVHS
ncbi:MAG TPA: PspC domain-containing protein [Bryobacteraceae bacterium]|nr:PspC domain-containing protein [Bryobacteraceae bacterium]